MTKNWHNLPASKAITLLKSNREKGLSYQEVIKRQSKFGLNELPSEEKFPSLRMLLSQLKSPLTIILIVNGIITIVLKKYLDSLVIWIAAILDITVSFFQEKKSFDVLEGLKKRIEHKAFVQRNGAKKLIDSREIVPGDIFFIKAGDQVPADGRIIKCKNLKINEAALTGEWVPANKHKRKIKTETPLADRDNMVYMGTIVESGTAKAICTEVRVKTQLGRTAILIKEIQDEQTPFQKKIAYLGKIITIFIILASTFIFITGVLAGKEFSEMLIASLAITVAAIPEGLPLGITTILAIAIKRISNDKGLVRKMVAAETLGSTSVIAIDKTGTITQGKMRVSNVLTPCQILKNKKDVKTKTSALEIALLNNKAFVEELENNRKVVRGTPIDKAILLAGLESRIVRDLEKNKKRLEEIPFDPSHKYVASLYQINKKTKKIYISGAPEKILNLSDRIQINSEEQRLTPQKFERINNRLNELTNSGLRVVAVSYKDLRKKIKIPNLKKEVNNLVFSGLIVLDDPIRKNIKETIRICKKAGIKPILVSGDHRLTVKTVAERIGLKTKKGRVIEGKDLDKMPDKELDRVVRNIQVYSRVEPHHKMRIIEAWQRKGEVIAMTGDGINDAPALKKADIGIALNSGTDVAKQVSDLILLSNSFKTIVGAIEEGRAILSNIRKVITYLLSDSLTEIILIGGSLVFGTPLPVLPIQILWTNLIEDGLPDIALCFEPKEKDVMDQRPETRKSPLLNPEMKTLIFNIGIIDDLLLLGLFFWLLNKTPDLSYIQTMVFTGLSIDTIFAALSCKSLRRNLWEINILNNKFLILAIIVGILALLAALYFSPLQRLLKTVPLSINDWMVLLALATIELILIEGTKYFFIRRRTTN